MEALVVAYGAGLAAAASPCLLPLYPAFLAYLTGSSGAEAGSTNARKVSGFLGLAVLLGLLTSMMLIGLAVFAIAVPMGQVLGFAIPFIDLLLIALGVMLLAGINPFMRVRSIRVPGARGPLSQAYVYGMFLGPIALPCAGPFLVALLAISVGAAESVGALATFFVFGLGFGLPLVLLSVLARARQDTVVRFLARHHRKIEILSGVLLVGAGLWDLSTNWESILLTFGL
ncbi:MAG: cytochrome c biogenesis protein CcdA [Chloroflexota bacterium]|nr:cytochrome c biogenesis protein CcdA [Chloroflexota bacterium]